MKLKDYHKRTLVVVLGILLYSLIYNLIQEITTRGVSINTALDIVIPFIPVFVLFYILWYPVVITPFILTLKDKTLFKKTAFSFSIIAVCSFAVYLIYQTEITRAVISSTDIFSRMVSYIYLHDMPINCFPSLHVSGSVLANLCVMNFNKKFAVFMIPITILIVLSTLFIKQHFVLDVVGGILLAFGAYLLVFEVNWDRLKEQLVAFRV